MAKEIDKFPMFPGTIKEFEKLVGFRVKIVDTGCVDKRIGIYQNDSIWRPSIQASELMDENDIVGIARCHESMYRDAGKLGYRCIHGIPLEKDFEAIPNKTSSSSNEKTDFSIFPGSIREFEDFIGFRVKIVDTGFADKGIAFYLEIDEWKPSRRDMETHEFINQNDIVAIIKCIETSYSKVNRYRVRRVYGIPVRKKTKSPKK